MDTELTDDSAVNPEHGLAEPPTARPGLRLPEATSEHPPHAGRRIALVGSLFLFLALLLMVIIRHHERVEKKAVARHASAGVTVTTATAQKGDIGIYFQAIGTVTPVYTDSITSEVNGLVTAVHFREGQRVRKGDPLIDIDDRPYRAMLVQAEGALERDQNLLAQAEMDLDRYRAAWARNGIAKQQLDDQEKLVLQDKGIVKNDQGVVQYDQVQVDFCHIRAPIAGLMGLRLVDPGNYVQSSGTTTLAVITQMEPTTVIFTIPEDSLGQILSRLKAGAKLPVDAFDRTAQTQIGSGTLLTVDNQIDTTTGTVKGRALFANKDDALFPNLFVNTRLLVNTLKQVTVVSSSAIQQNGQASFVYVIENGYAHQRSVKAGVTDKGMTEIEGVGPGDVLADSGFDKLQDNVKVVVENKPASSATPLGTGQPAASQPTGGNAP